MGLSGRRPSSGTASLMELARKSPVRDEARHPGDGRFASWDAEEFSSPFEPNGASNMPRADESRLASLTSTARRRSDFRRPVPALTRASRKARATSLGQGRGRGDRRNRLARLGLPVFLNFLGSVAE